MEKYVHSHFGVYALIVNSQNEVLVIKKMRGPYTGMFDLPGGTPEPLELLEETLIREVNEETSCKVVDFKQLGAFSIRYDYKKNDAPATIRHFAAIYQCNIMGTPRADGDGEDAGGCVWLPIHKISEFSVTPFTKIALNAMFPLTHSI
ncbi:MAG: NUDIX domain-containing protein [Bacteroidetes bacterium]|nr:NUDIX domain-containing protein [Bacteroidota bacterium]